MHVKGLSKSDVQNNKNDRSRNPPREIGPGQLDQYRPGGQLSNTYLYGKRVPTWRIRPGDNFMGVGAIDKANVSSKVVQERSR